MEVKSNGVEVNEWARAPDDRSGCSRFLRAIYNKDEKTFLGRTATRWGIMLAFYSVFYAVLAVLFAVCMGGLMASLSPGRPSFTLTESLIGANPGVAYRPRPEDSDDLVKYDKLNKTLIQKYVDQMKLFFEEYKMDPRFSTQKECTEKDNFGFPDTPCFFIKLNKVYGWVPEYFDDSLLPLPADMPADLLAYIQGLDVTQRNQVWMSCVDESKQQNLTITYPWGRGLSHLYFPFTNSDTYRGQLVAIKVTSAVNVPATIQCRFWANNVRYNKSMKEPSGYTRIQLLVQDSTATQTQ